MRCTLLALLGSLLVAATSAAAEVLPAVRTRYATAQTKETPDFQRHVAPLLGRLGCNGRACHGSFQGKGGFRLSLFGYDFAMDHRALTQTVGDTGEKHINRREPAKSLLLEKPMRLLPHRGVDSPAALTQLEVVPREIVFNSAGQKQSLQVIAHWQEDSREDVTCLCRFQSNDDSVAAVNDNGQVQAIGKGDTHVVIFYDRGVATVPVLLPVSENTGPRYPRVATPTRIDELVVAKLAKLGIEPSPSCTDTEFLRRVSLDVTGTLPAPAEIEKFLADPTPDKRARKIDELLDSPAYAAWWANRFSDITGNSRFRQSEGRIGQQLAVQWYTWLYHRLQDNVPYDRLVAGMVVARGRDAGQSYDDYARQTSAYFRDQAPANFALRPTMPHFWTRQNVGKPEEKALSFAHSFLGIRLECAQCHKHPYDQWTQDDFKQLASLLAGVTYGVAPESRPAYQKLTRATGARPRGNQGVPITLELLALAQEGKTIPWRELYIDTGKVPTGQTVQLLGSTVHLQAGDDPRQMVMDWLRGEDNPYFARALVNRVWANYFHRGLIEPVDDLNLANPPSNQQLLDHLTSDFVQHGYDLKRLHRLITNSLTYQRSWKPTASNRDDTRNFSRFIPRRLPAEVLYDALKQATVAEAELKSVRADLDRRAIGHLSTGLTGTYAMRVFGKPERILNCDCERSNQPTLLQAIFLQNDPLIHLRLQESGWLKEVAQREKEGKVDLEALIRHAYLRCLSRAPTTLERTRVNKYLTEADSTAAGLQDLLWVLLNSKEFLLNH
jgi:hypothetical protein